MSGVCRLLFKADNMSNTLIQNKTAQTQRVDAGAVSAAVGFLSADLMEQFLAYCIASAVFVLSMGIVYGLYLGLTVLFPVASEKVVAFVSSTSNDVAGAHHVNYSRNCLNFTTIFTLALIANVTGMLPYSFTFTSSVVVPFIFSIAVFAVYVFTVLRRFGFKAFAGFLPAGTDIFIAPLITLIEIVSTFAKFVSLGVRLFANMFAGHLLLKVFYSLAFIILAGGFSFAAALAEVSTSVFLFFIIALELLIAVLQAFVLLLLISLYVQEAENFALGH